MNLVFTKKDANKILGRCSGCGREILVEHLPGMSHLSQIDLDLVTYFTCPNPNCVCSSGGTSEAEGKDLVKNLIKI